MAAQDHAKHLRKGESRPAQAKGLAETLRCALRSDDYDPEPFADEIVAQIIDLLDKAQSQVDRHSREHSNLFLAYFEQKRNAPDGSTDDWQRSALAAIDRLDSEYAEKTPQECAARLRKFNYDVSENLAASMYEDGYTVTKTWTRKGVRHFLAEREFMESLLSDEC